MLPLWFSFVLFLMLLLGEGKFVPTEPGWGGSWIVPSAVSPGGWSGSGVLFTLPLHNVLLWEVSKGSVCSRTQPAAVRGEGAERPPPPGRPCKCLCVKFSF